MTRYMRKAVLSVLAIASLCFAACGNKNAVSEGVRHDGDKAVLYSGILPAADAQGTIYSLRLEFDADHNFTDGEFVLMENSIAADTSDPSGLKVAASSYTEGEFRKASKNIDGAEIEYICLIPDLKGALGTASASSLYFLINADESLTMVGEDLQKSVTPELNYTLTVK